MRTDADRGDRIRTQTAEGREEYMMLSYDADKPMVRQIKRDTCISHSPPSRRSVHMRDNTTDGGSGQRSRPLVSLGRSGHNSSLGTMEPSYPSIRIVSRLTCSLISGSR